LYGPPKVKSKLSPSTLAHSKLPPDLFKKYKFLNVPSQPFNINTFNELNLADPFSFENSKATNELENKRIPDRDSYSDMSVLVYARSRFTDG